MTQYEQNMNYNYNNYFETIIIAMFTVLYLY